MDKSLNADTELSKYVVRGAEISCTLGSRHELLNMPFSHGVFLKDKAQLSIADRKGGENIISFGQCKKTSPWPPCTPTFGCDWINMQDTKVKIEGKDALIQNAYLICAAGGGVIKIETCGQ